MGDPQQQSVWQVWIYRLLVTLFVIGLVGSTAAIWANNRIQESDAWASTVGPLADDPAVQDFVVDQAAAVIDRQIAADDDAGRLQSFTRSQLSGIVRMALHEFVTTPAFATWWTESNRATHSLLMHVNKDSTGVLLQTRDSELVLDLQPVVDWTNERLEGLFPRTGYTITLPPERSVIVLYSSEFLGSLNRVIDLVDMLSVALPILTLVSFVGVMALTRSRMNALMQIGLALIAGVAGIILVITIARLWVVSQQPESHKDALDAVVRIVLSDLMLAFRALALIGMILVACVLAVRGVVPDRERIGGLLRDNRQAIAIAIMGVALLILIAASYPPFWLTSLVLAVIALAAVLLIKWRSEASAGSI